MCASASIHPLYLCSCLCVPISECFCCMSPFPVCLFVYLCQSLSFSLSLGIWVSSVSLFLHGCVSLCPHRRVSLPFSVGSVRLFCVCLCICLFFPLVSPCESFYLSLWVSLIPGPHARGRRAPLPELSSVHARQRVQGSEMLGAD